MRDLWMRFGTGARVTLAASTCAGALAVAPSAVTAHLGAVAKFACSGPNAAHQPCRFSTPSGNVRCLWTPNPDRVQCELVATRRGFALRPSGVAHAIRLNLRRRGQTLPTNQQLVFPHSLSCRDGPRTMTCNQDFGEGSFRLGRRR